jgi:ATP-binding cassette subfamily F protein 3
VDPFEGDIEDYRRMVLGRSDAVDATPAKPQRLVSQKELRREAAERREALAPLRKKIQECERSIERLRAEIANLDKQLAEPDLYARDPDRATELAKRRAERVHAFARAESDWLDFSGELESAEAEASAA